MSARDLLIEISISRGDNSSVNWNWLGRANGNHFAMLKHTKKLDLRRRRSLADFVEEERSTFGRSEHSCFVFHRAGERSLHVSEQLTLEQAFRKSSAVYRHEGIRRSVRQLVNVPRNDSLTSSRFTLQKHRRISLGNGLGNVKNLEPRTICPDGLADFIAPLDLFL